MTAVFISILMILLMSYPKNTKMNFTEELLNTSNFILSEYWEDTDAGSAAFGLSTFVNNRRFPFYKQELFKNFTCFRIYRNYHARTLILHILLLGGDISLNPGPIKFPCGKCVKSVRSNQDALQCEDCDVWTHRNCLAMSKQEYYRLGTCTESWFCETCTLPQFTDSFFSIDESNSSNITLLSTDGESIISPNISAQIHDEQDSGSVADSEETYDIFKTLHDLRKGNIKRPILCHININSLRYKFNDLKPILIDRLCDILVIFETKLDDSFNNNLFAVNGYKLEHKDRNANGGGIMVFLERIYLSDGSTI